MKRKLRRENALEIGKRLAADKSNVPFSQSDTNSGLAWIPAHHQSQRLMPNHFARSSLFSPIRRGPRRIHENALLVTRADAVLRYSGEQLDEADADVCMQLLYAASLVPVGHYVKLNRASLLRGMGRCCGKKDYVWLERRLRALCTGTLSLIVKNPNGQVKLSVGSTIPFSILQRLETDPTATLFTFRLDPRWPEVFGNREFIRLCWEKRLMIKRGQDMARALQRLFATSSDPVQRFSLEWLKAKLQYAGQMRDFRAALLRSIQELERVEVLKHGFIGKSTRQKDQLTVHISSG
ncbi:MAG TPA: plasmid-related transcriptional repressor protein [Betaproteobacteria bacterium]|nr:plasmid-related transcriptional repressor protein [Betaproteobacteria bacterium]